MGRRAKNKQGNPEPLAQVLENEPRPSSKKLGKRKAEETDVKEGLSKRPVKKARESTGNGNATAKNSQDNGRVDKGGVKAKAALSKSKTKGKRRKEDDEDEGSSEGWEDVQDEGDLRAQAK